jgi:transcriptional regulator with XRE-family HTH domain
MPRDKAPRGELLTAPITEEVTPARARVARQLQALASRHKITDTEEFARRIAAEWKVSDGSKPAALTFRRWLRQENDASRASLRKIAEHLGETLDQAFPERDADYSSTISGRNYYLRTDDGLPVDPKVKAMLDAMAAGFDFTIATQQRDEKLNRTTPKLPAGRRRS